MNAARKLILICASLPLFAAPTASFADETAAMNACVDAFVATNLPKEQKVRLKALQPEISPVDLHARYYKISMTAKGVESGKRLASATCVVKADGTLVTLNGKAPVASSLATLTSR